MDRFDRISVDPHVMHGQPCIRQTSITVSQIVQLSAQGNSVHDVLLLCPELEFEDVFQALNFAIVDLTQGIAFWKHEGLTPLTSVRGYCELLLNSDPLMVPDDLRQEFTQIIFQNARRGIAIWQHLRDWSRISYDAGGTRDSSTLTPTHFFEIINDAMRLASEYEPSASFELMIPDDLPYVACSSYLPAALANLMVDRTTARHIKPEGTVLITNDDALIIQIHRKYERTTTINGANHLFVRNTPFATAALILQHHESTIQIVPGEDELTFEFHLATLDKASDVK